jgi:hypothetical protein
MTLYGLNETKLTFEDLAKGVKMASKAESGAELESKLAVKVSDECMSCGDEKIKRRINQAFKMACI